ncbi:MULTISPECIES: ADP-ribosylglycohydrolase family protein [Microbacterium]|uniref:ADP-ribosylglycohydrolase family protein n=1 Tax=Microbacterium wangchenii TaxID=2541726 RepID=A0ABX5SZX9_9MICO|nr:MULTISPECIES: ADP-ribosylglycohydrolase family protein [Microbacterium]MCK6066113.1 ADP-ribosylglycohydrolase family protein [Microbacterium sp. EYE_512]QBR90394.1 hypothetical protein E4K62_17930 [Microbacterium wangchenii]TFV84799.1 hypothetical protein E4V99_07080 [Microbacterium sp. dk485]TXK11590.1 hypothetical protein FVP99_14295 [Microbacterium wangchenii]
MTTSNRRHRATALVRGLALGDALGAPASEHRTVRDPWVRGMLREGAAQLDSSRVIRPVLPFVLSAVGAAPLVATDDAEGFAIAARTLLDTHEWTADSLFETWIGLVSGEDAWAGPAQRSALLNAAAGLRPPQTGADNPAFYDDTALPGSLAVGIAVAEPRVAAEVARDLATLTHDDVGVHAAAVVARLVSSLLGETALATALEDATDLAAADDWLVDGIREAFALVDAAPSPFAAVPALVARFAPRTYSHGGTVTETLPLALAILRGTDGDHERALPLALSITRHQDSLPALVGALCGAAGSPIADHGLSRLTGVLNPVTAGWSLSELVADLSALAERGV